MDYGFFNILIIISLINTVTGIKFSVESFSEISLLAKEGEVRLESLREKIKVPQYGSCWKSAISNLQIGCKFLSENVQSDLALRFTDCFLQMSGDKPINCDFPKSKCLKNLSDRAFNAYTEFYTHTQSICYFLQSQIWQEENEKTIDRLSATSLYVSQQLEEAGKIQEKLLDQQRKSLSLQHDLIENNKNMSLNLKLSQETINKIMKDFHSATVEQKQMFIELIENLMSLKLWAIDEMSWFSSTLFFVAATVIGFLFTSISRTKEARITIFVFFTLNYLIERFIFSKSLTDITYLTEIGLTTDTVNSWIWIGRKFCICISAAVIFYTALMYCDYNVINYKLLLEIKNQNHKILNQFSLLKKSPDLENNHKKNYFLNNEHQRPGYESKFPFYSTSKNYNQGYNGGSRLSREFLDKDIKNNFLTVDDIDYANADCTDEVFLKLKKPKIHEPKSVYNLRSSNITKI